MIRHAIALVIMLTALGTAAYSAVECRVEPPANRTGYWSWRNIDGKRCWYPGRAGMDKANLKWPRTADPDTALLESYWPNLKELRRQP